MTDQQWQGSGNRAISPQRADAWTGIVTHIASVFASCLFVWGVFVLFVFVFPSRYLLSLLTSGSLVSVTWQEARLFETALLG